MLNIVYTCTHTIILPFYFFCHHCSKIDFSTSLSLPKSQPEKLEFSIDFILNDKDFLVFSKLNPLKSQIQSPPSLIISPTRPFSCTLLLCSLGKAKHLLHDSSISMWFLSTNYVNKQKTNILENILLWFCFLNGSIYIRKTLVF
jgi:hypothetical protein